MSVSLFFIGLIDKYSLKIVDTRRVDKLEFIITIFNVETE